jgi:two-component system, sporulation sensor kinase E
MNGKSLRDNYGRRSIFKKISERLKYPGFTKLSTRLLFTLTMLAALPLITVGLFMTSVTQDTLSEYVKGRHSEIARRASTEIILFLETPISNLKILLETQDITEMNEFAQNLIINKVKSMNPIFTRIFIADSNGIEITSSAFVTDSANYSKEEFFRKAITGESSISAVYFNEVKEPYFISSHPIKRFDQVIGVLAGEINLRSIWTLVDEIKLGEQGNAFVININGQLIAYKNKKKVLEKAEVIDINVVKAAINSDEKTKIFTSPEDITMLGTFEYIPDFDWILVLQQPVDEAYAVVSRMLYQVFAFVGLVILVAILLAYLLEKRITHPINTMIGGVQRYANGDLNYRIYVPKYDEIAVLAEEFNSMAEKLQENQRKLRRVERLAAMSKFATLVSHEIRNPLNSMIINMQILKREMERSQAETTKIHKYYDIIISEIQRMDNLINNFMMISRSPRLDFLPDDLHDILDEVVLMHTVTAEHQHVRIQKRYVGKKILANVDRDQLKQVFHNILINSLQAMPQGGTLTISTQVQRQRHRSKKKAMFLRIEFADTGLGIPKDKIKDIFEFYYTSKKTGTGLGLAIARQIIDGHNGSISVESEEHKGTRLILHIPMKSESASIKRASEMKMRSS